MGGIGSGNRKPRDARDIAERNCRLDVRRLAREKCLRPGLVCGWGWSVRDGKEIASISFCVGEKTIFLFYWYQRRCGEWRPVEQNIPLDRTPCNFGGHRYWFRCPGCDRRVATLYAAGHFFLCRHCYGLSYASSQEGDLDRLMRKARKIRGRIGASKNLFSPIILKPRGMHRDTFMTIRLEAMRIENTINHVMASQLGIHL